jgi:hypothetical protein
LNSLRRVTDKAFQTIEQNQMKKIITVCIITSTTFITQAQLPGNDTIEFPYQNLAKTLPGTRMLDWKPSPDKHLNWP